MVVRYCVERRETKEVRPTCAYGKYLLHVGRAEKASIKPTRLHDIRVEARASRKSAGVHRRLVLVQIQKFAERGGGVQRLGVY